MLMFTYCLIEQPCYKHDIPIYQYAETLHIDTLESHWGEALMQIYANITLTTSMTSIPGEKGSKPGNALKYRPY